MADLALEFYLLNADGTIRCPLPAMQGFQISAELNTPGAVAFDYPVDGDNWDQLHEFVQLRKVAQVSIWWNGSAVGALRVILVKASVNRAEEGTVASYGGHFYEYRLTKTLVWPQAGGEANEFKIVLSNRTAGVIIKTLLGHAAARGALTDLGFDFTDFVDSLGAAWNTTADISLAPGTTFLDVLNKLSAAGMCDWEVRGTTLRLYNAGTRGVDRTALDPPVAGTGLFPSNRLYPGNNLFPSDVQHATNTFQAGLDLIDAPTTYDASQRVSSLLLNNGQTIYSAVDDVDTQTLIGWREEGYAQTTVDDIATLLRFGTINMQIAKQTDYEISAGLTLHPSASLPLRDFNLGDWVWMDTSGVREKVQVVQWTISRQAAEDRLSGTITCGTRIDDDLLRLARKLAGVGDANAVVRVLS